MVLLVTFIFLNWIKIQFKQIWVSGLATAWLFHQVPKATAYEIWITQNEWHIQVSKAITYRGKINCAECTQISESLWIFFVPGFLSKSLKLYQLFSKCEQIFKRFKRASKRDGNADDHRRMSKHIWCRHRSAPMPEVKRELRSLSWAFPPFVSSANHKLIKKRQTQTQSRFKHQRSLSWADLHFFLCILLLHSWLTLLPSFCSSANLKYWHFY